MDNKKKSQIDELRDFLYDESSDMKLDSAAKLKDRIKEYLKATFSLRFDNAAQEIIEERVLKATRLRGTNMAILAFSIVIASIGLNTNSTAVIIGAMLISPLMGSILGIAYGFVTQEMRTVRFAVISFIAQILIAVVSSAIYFTISPISIASSELLARTHPTILDVIIALCGGLAGAIGVTRKETNNVIPGVAIATALMPPLCTIGYGISILKFKYILGASYLFFINSFYIAISTIIVLKIVGIESPEIINSRLIKRARFHIIVILIVTIVPSLLLGYQIIKNQHKEYSYKNYITNETYYKDTALVGDELDEDEKIIRLVFVGEKLTDKQIKELEKDKLDYDLKEYKLNIIENNE